MHRQIVSLSAVKELIVEDALHQLESKIMDTMVCEEWNQLIVAIANSHGVRDEDVDTALLSHAGVIKDIMRFKKITFVQKMVEFKAVWKNKKPGNIFETLLATQYSKRQLSDIAKKIDASLPDSCAIAHCWYDLEMGQMWVFNNLLAEKAHQLMNYGFVPGGLLDRKKFLSVKQIADSLKKLIGENKQDNLAKLVSAYCFPIMNRPPLFDWCEERGTTFYMEY